MTTVYSACLSRLGLSQAAAARLHNVRPDTVKSWAQGRNRPPPNVFNDLRALEAKIVDHAEQMREEWAAAAVRQVHIDASDADHLGAMAYADFILGLDGVEIVDGATEATIAARNLRKMAG